MSEQEKDVKEHASGGFEVHTYGKVAFVTVTDDVVKAAREASQAARDKRDAESEGANARE